MTQTQCKNIVLGLLAILLFPVGLACILGMITAAAAFVCLLILLVAAVAVLAVPVLVCGLVISELDQRFN